MCQGPWDGLIFLCSSNRDHTWCVCGANCVFKLEGIYGSCIGVVGHRYSVMKRDTGLPYHVFSIIGHGTTIWVHVVHTSVALRYGSLYGGIGHGYGLLGVSVINYSLMGCDTTCLSYLYVQFSYIFKYENLYLFVYMFIFSNTKK